MTDAATECLPPDPSVSGLWWVEHPKHGMFVWRWSPSVPLFSALWLSGMDGLLAEDAHEAGWRVIAPAVPPGDAA